MRIRRAREPVKFDQRRPISPSRDEPATRPNAHSYILTRPAASATVCPCSTDERRHSCHLSGASRVRTFKETIGDRIGATWTPKNPIVSAAEDRSVKRPIGFTGYDFLGDRINLLAVRSPDQ